MSDVLDKNKVSDNFEDSQNEDVSKTSSNDAVMRDLLIGIMQESGIEVETDWQKGQAILDAANNQVKYQSGDKKATASERSGAVAGNSSSDSLNFDTKERLSRHAFGVQNLDAKILQNTESTKNKLSKIKKRCDFNYIVCNFS